jgi:hypothetical protein
MNIGIERKPNGFGPDVRNNAASVAEVSRSGVRAKGGNSVLFYLGNDSIAKFAIEESDPIRQT